MLRFPWVRLMAAAAAALLLSSPPAAAKIFKPAPVPDAWQRPHADGGNTSFANVVTAPAVKPSRTIGHIGAFGVGSGPVIGPDGTVYVGTLQGKLLAFHPDGSRAWDRQLDAGQEILASPVVGSDGAIFVVSQSISTDTRVSPPFTRPDSTLHKFLPGGGYAWKMPFPERGTNLPVPNGSGGTNAAPNIWRYNGEEAVIIPVLYKSHTAPTREVRLLAFSASGGGVLGDARVSMHVPTVTGSSELCDGDCIDGFGFEGNPINDDPKTLVSRDLRLPLASAAVYTLPGGGTPWIVVADNLHDIVGFTLSPQTGFFEGFRAHEESWKLTGMPMVMPDAETFVSEAGDVITWRGQAIRKPPRTIVEPNVLTGAARTATGDVLLIVGNQLWVRHPGGTKLRDLDFIKMPGESIVPPAVSQKHVFVSVANAFLTYDSATMQQVARFDWLKGGISPPAIGPTGDVYAIADNTLHVFPGLCAACKELPPLDDLPTLTAVPTPPAATGQSHFENPQGPHGLRLYACTTVGGDDCGKPVAKAFCQAQGWAKADKYDTKSKKVQAETLAGEACDNNKCKVFDFINCEN